MTSGSSMQATDPRRPTAGRADIDIEHLLQALCPGHRGTAFRCCWFLSLRCRDGLASPTPLGRCHPRAVLAVGREHDVKTRQINSRLRHKRCQPGDKIQWIENDVGGAVTVWCLQLVTNVAVRRERQALFRDGGSADIATQPLELLALIRLRRHTGVQGKSSDLTDPGIEGFVTGRQRLQREYLADQQRGTLGHTAVRRHSGWLPCQPATATYSHPCEIFTVSG